MAKSSIKILILQLKLEIVAGAVLVFYKNLTRII